MLGAITDVGKTNYLKRTNHVSCAKGQIILFVSKPRINETFKVTEKMMRRKYNTDELAFIQSNSHKFSQYELTERFNKRFNANQSISSIRGICHRYGWKTNNKNKSCFKAGNIPTNTRPIGSTRTTINGYTQIKTKNGWEYKHRIIFEAHYGSLSKTERIIFTDNNKQNFDIENLMKVTPPSRELSTDLA